MDAKKILRTLQVELPFLLEAKFAAMRSIRTALHIPFERDFAAIPQLQAPRGALFLDVGANRGQSTDSILMAQPDAHVLQFEPNALLCERLRRQFEGDERVSVHDFGLGDAESSAVLHVPFYKNWMFDGLASFDESAASGWLRGRMYFYNESHLRVEKSMCRVRRLDELNLTPFFIKIDVQGFEHQVLRGGLQTLKKHRPVLLIESPRPEIVSLLHGIGYGKFAFRRGQLLPGERGCPNTFFLHSQHRAVVRPSRVAAA